MRYNSDGIPVEQQSLRLPGHTRCKVSGRKLTNPADSQIRKEIMMDFYTAFQEFTARIPAVDGWVLILGLVMLCILACIFFSMLSASKLPEPKPKNEKCYRPGCTGKMINQVSRSANHKTYDIYVCNICGAAKGVEVNNIVKTVTYMGGR